MVTEIAGEEEGAEAGEPPVSPPPAAVKQFELLEMSPHLPRDLVLYTVL